MWGTRCGILLVWKILKETGLLVCSCSQKKDLSIKETRGEIFIGPIVIFFSVYVEYFEDVWLTAKETKLDPLCFGDRRLSTK